MSYDPDQGVDVDGGDLSNSTATLQEALNFTNSTESMDVIVFKSNNDASEITLDDLQLSVLRDTAIVGPDADR